LLLQTQSFFALFFAIFFLKEPYHPRQAMGFFTALVGILLVATHLGQDAPPLGLALVLLSAGMWAMGSVVARKVKGLSGAHLVMWGSLFAWPPLLAFSLLIEGPSRILACCQTWAPLPLAALLYTAYGATIAGFGIWNHLLQRYPLSKVSPFTLLVPIVGMLAASLLLNEPLPWWKIGAGVLILGGLCIHQGISWKRASPGLSSNPENKY
jgi:O-acetylserine/cysteine efflux transporter